MNQIMTSSFSFDRALGQSRYDWPDPPVPPVLQDSGLGQLTLLDLPTQLALRGMRMLEICHFHFPRVDDDYLRQLRQALDESGVELFSILIDARDITHPNLEQRSKDILFLQHWMDIAVAVGARGVRVVAGNAEAVCEGNWHQLEAVQVSAKGLRALAAVGRELGLQVFTENFCPPGKTGALGSKAGALNAILGPMRGRSGVVCGFWQLSWCR